SGNFAHTGKGALVLTNADVFHAGAPAQAGKRYRLSGWLKSERDGIGARLQINWKAEKLIKYELKQFQLTTEYQQFELLVEAPPLTTSATLIIGGGKDQELIYLDDVSYAEVTK
ncbi:MAG: hypothetical protein WCI73_02275, partial [Phycisphaerae bacterium]